MFLGYGFSERRGHEGLHHFSGGTKLFDETDHLNPQKVSSYIYRAFLGEICKVDESLSKNVSFERMSGFIEYGTSNFNIAINLAKVNQGSVEPTAHSAIFSGKYPIVHISSIAKVQGGKRLAAGENFSAEKTDFPYIRVSDFKDHSIDTTNLQYISGVQHDKISKYVIRTSDIYISIAGTLGLVGLIPDVLDGANLTENAARITPNTSRIEKKFLMYMLCSGFVQQQIQNATVGLGTPKLSLGRIKDLRIPLPPLDIQQVVLNKFEQAEKREQELYGQINQIQSKKVDLAETCYEKVKNLVKLKRVAHYATERIDASFLGRDTYVGVDNLLPDVGGKRASDYVPSSGTVTSYHQDDILLSNIRPYLKKAWLADNDGGCSGDVLVLQIDRTIALPEYVFLHTSSERFFEYEMQNIGSNVKMPRADKKKVLDYQIPLPSLEVQMEIVQKILGLEDQMTHLKGCLLEIKAGKEAIISKYL